MNTANKLTMARVVMIPIFLAVLYLVIPPYHNYIALARSPISASSWTLWPTNCWWYPPCCGSSRSAGCPLGAS